MPGESSDADNEKLKESQVTVALAAVHMICENRSRTQKNQTHNRAASNSKSLEHNHALSGWLRHFACKRASSCKRGVILTVTSVQTKDTLTMQSPTSNCTTTLW